MSAFLKTHSAFLLALACYLLGGLTVWTWEQPAAPTGTVLTPKQAREATQEALKAQAAAATHNTAGDTARAHSTPLYVAAKAAEKQALTYHAQSHAPLRPLADTTAERLQRYLSAY